MATLKVAGGELAWSLIDLTPPWLSAPQTLSASQTIVMHHGVGANQHIFDGWLPALIGNYRILRFDMRGHGNSPRPDAGVKLDMERLTDDLFAVMDAAGVERAHLMGESIGGTIVLAAALRAPERVATLAISNGAHLGASIRSVTDWQQIIETRGMAGWSAHMMQGRFHPGAIPEDLWRWFETQQATACGDTVLRLLEALVGANLVDKLPGLRPPLLLMHPDGSPFIPVPVMDEFRALAPNARLHVIGHAKHGLPFSHAAICAGLLRGFLDEHPG